MNVQKIKLSSYDFSWLVLDNNYLPIKPITEFIRYLNNVDKSPFTVRSYAHYLKLFWEKPNKAFACFTHSRWLK